MTQGKKGRGRPKGSGKNDRDTLLQIAAICAADPTIKRTTAIKKLGITNPSVVRRLRDKFAADADALIAEVKAAADPAAHRVRAATAKPQAPKSGGKGKSGKAGAAANTAASAQPTEEPIIAIAQPKPAAEATASATGTNTASGTAASGQPQHLNFEEIVIDVITQVLGISAEDLADTPVLSLIKEQAKLIDMVLPLIASQFAAPAQQQRKVA
jgi:hypothetical protein